MRKEKGITLIALVVTIVVLLILAGVSISMLTGENGIITQANNAKLQNEFGEVTEGMTLVASEYVMEKNDGEIQDFLTWLETKKIIDGSGKISTQDLLNRTLSTGNGTGTNDIYQLKQSSEESGQYDILYYYKDGKDVNLKTLTISEGIYPEATPEDKFYYSDTEEGVTLIGFHYETYINIPEYYDEGSGYYFTEDGEQIGRNPIGYLYMLNSNDLKTDIVIPKTINNKKVISLQMGESFLSNTNIKTITIPYSVKEISNNMFRNTPFLTTISFPEGKNPELEIPDNKWGAGSDVQIIGKNGEVLK